MAWPYPTMSANRSPNATLLISSHVEEEMSEIDHDEYDVYSALCQTTLFRFGIGGTRFDDHTGDDPFSGDIGGRLNGQLKYLVLKHRDLLDDYKQKNSHAARLEKKFIVEGGYEFVTEEERLRPNFTGEVFTLSRVGFNAQKSLALVHIYYHGGPMCAVGYLVLFENSQSGWAKLEFCRTSTS
jgi:hypothetical protein